MLRTRWTCPQGFGSPRSILPERREYLLPAKTADEKCQEVSMRDRHVFLLLSSFTLFLLLTSVTLTFAAQPPDPQTKPYVDDEVIVKFREGRDEHRKLMT